MRETPLAESIPLWVTMRQNDVTVLITPAGDYVSALELGTLDERYSGEERRENVGEALRGFVGGLEEDTTLHFIYRVDSSSEEVYQEYESLCSAAKNAAFAEYVKGRSDWLRRQPARSTRVFLFASHGCGGFGNGTTRGRLGLKLPYRSTAALDEKWHCAQLKKAAQLRDRIAAQLGKEQIGSRELTPEEVQALHWRMLNPARARKGDQPPSVHLHQDLWSEETIRREGDYLQEYTEPEQLTFESLQDARGYFLHGGVFRRVCTLKILPEDHTNYFAALPFLTLATNSEGEQLPFPYWLAVTVHIRPQRRFRWMLSKKHDFVQMARELSERVRRRSVDEDEEDSAKETSLRGLFNELNNMASRIAAVSVSVMLESDTADGLEAQSDSLRAAFSECGNSQLLGEEFSQVPAFLSMLPGAGPYQLRRKGCTSRNAADFMPLFAPWRGCTQPYSVVRTPEGDLFQLDLFDADYPSHHGTLIGDTGSGKNVSMGLFVLEAQAAGSEAILVDNGGSWKVLTELFGGTHVEFDLKTSVCPFQEYESIYDAVLGGIDKEELENTVIFLELCLQDRDLPVLSKLQSDVLSRAILWQYERLFKNEPRRLPIMEDFRDALLKYQWKHPDDKVIAEDLARRLRIYCDGMYGDLLNRPSPLRFDAPLITVDLQHVVQKENTKQIAVAVLMQAIGHRSKHRRVRTIVPWDEVHGLLQSDISRQNRTDVVPRFLADCYRRGRKYGFAIWAMTQQFADLAESQVGPAILGNSAIKAFLYHGSNRDRVSNYFAFSQGQRAAFDGLRIRPGYYSDLLLMYGERTTVLRHAPHPLAYWLLTTHPREVAARERAFIRNPQVSRMDVLRELAERFPHGLVGQRIARKDRAAA